MKIPFLLFLLFISAFSSSFASSAANPDSSYVEKVVQKALELKLDQNQQWWNLLNYRRDFYFWKRSQADNPDFFLSGTPWSPREELVATLRGIFNPQLMRKSPDGSLDERVTCFFPGRYLWLTRNLPGVEWPELKCQRFENFKGILNTQSVTYVFSSYYLNNPSSAYGHSFLRLNRASEAKGEKRFELIDFGVGYTAVPTTGHAVLYAFMGIFGMFPGRFETNPYYFKVREYNDFENRDLWEYDLDFTPQEVELLVAHIFELDVGGFKYIYFTENCAYRILAMLDAVRPSLNLVEKTKIDVIPGDSIMLVAETPGLVKNLHYRPSGRAIFAAREATLTSDQKSQLSQFIRDEKVDELVEKKTELEKQQLLDAAMDYIDFKYADDVLKEKGRYKLKKEVLIKRSEVNLVSPELKVPTPERAAPHTAHGSARWSLGYLNANDTDVVTVGHRFALHDLLDPVTGYLSGSEIEMFDFNFTWDVDQTHRFQLKNFDFVQIASLAPRDDINKNLSWRLNVSLDRLYQDNCSEDCLPAIVAGGVGWAQEYQNILASVWIKGSLAYSSEFAHEKFLFGAGPAFLGKYYFTDKFNILAEAWYRYDYKAVQSDFREASVGAQYNFHKDLGLRATWRSDRQYQMELKYYY